MKKATIFFILLVLLSSCSPQGVGEWRVENIDKDTIFEDSVDGTVYGIELNIQGEVDDSIRIQHLKFGGKIDSKIILDAYNKKVSVSYESLKAKKGHLIIKYKIFQF